MMASGRLVVTPTRTPAATGGIDNRAVAEKNPERESREEGS